MNDCYMRLTLYQRIFPDDDEYVYVIRENATWAYIPVKMIQRVQIPFDFSKSDLSTLPHIIDRPNQLKVYIDMLKPTECQHMVINLQETWEEILETAENSYFAFFNYYFYEEDEK